MIRDRTNISMVIAVALLAALIAAPAAAARTISVNGINVFVGEENLGLAGDFAGTTQLVHYTGEAGNSPIDKSIVVVGGSIAELTKGIPMGAYYAMGSMDPTRTYVIVQNPETTLDVVLNSSPKDSVNGKSVSRGTGLNFKFYSNVDTGAAANVELTLPGGGVVTTYDDIALAFNANGQTQHLPNVVFGSNAEAGTYTAVAKWARTTDFFGKGFDSNPVTFEILTKALSITVNKDRVVRGNSFIVAVTGETRSNYHLYVREISGVAPGAYPLIAPGQTAVIYGIPGESDWNRTIRTNAAGTATVQFNTSPKTGEWRFTIRVEDPFAPEIHDDVRVQVEKGAVTITASGTDTYYIGEEITLSGTSTEGDRIYLFMTGPNLAANGVTLTTLERVETLNLASFKDTAAVNADDTWSFRWNTAKLAESGRSLDAGSYTIYAVSTNVSKADLSDARYATASINLRSGFITATASGATLAKGDALTISGTATGNPSNVCIWIFGKNYSRLQQPVPLRPDGGFEYRVAPRDTANLPSGQCFVVVQHPMNDVFDVWASGTTLTGNGITPVDLASLPAADAANALIAALDSPDIDDIYANLTVVIEEPRILINPISNQTAGSVFAISGTTNLAAGDTLNVEVTSTAFQPGSKTEASNFSSAAGTVTVQKGDGANKWSFEVDATDLRPDHYIVRVESIETATTATATFYVTEGHEPPPSGPALTLHPGWNFISVPRLLAAGNDTAAIFAGVRTDNRSLFRYDTAARGWVALDKDDRIAPLEGFWIYSVGPATVPLNFSTALPVPPAERALSTGWNAIGTASGRVPPTARDALLSVNGQWTTLIGFDARAQVFEMAIVNSGKDAYADSREVYPGRGYWLYMTGPGTLCAIGV
ncbi:hypothetical protein DSECCO2_407180 [anaerobic digester metagenome]